MAADKMMPEHLSKIDNNAAASAFLLTHDVLDVLQQAVRAAEEYEAVQPNNLNPVAMADEFFLLKGGIDTTPIGTAIKPELHEANATSVDRKSDTRGDDADHNAGDEVPRDNHRKR